MGKKETNILQVSMTQVVGAGPPDLALVWRRFRRSPAPALKCFGGGASPEPKRICNPQLQEAWQWKDWGL